MDVFNEAMPERSAEGSLEMAVSNGGKDNKGRKEEKGKGEKRTDGEWCLPLRRKEDVDGGCESRPEAWELKKARVEGSKRGSK